MAVIRSNSIEGITQLIADGSTIEFKKPDGSPAELGKINLNTDVGISTFNEIRVGSGITIEANGQATFVGIVTFGSSSTTIDGDANTIKVGTALTLGHTQGLQFHTQNLHSAGFEVNQMNASGIVTANTFSGSGASLTSIPAAQLTGESSTKIVGSDAQNNTLAGSGAGSGFSGNSAANNTIFGHNSGSNVTTGDNNIILGKSAQASSATVSNEITLGDANITKFRIPGLNFVIKDHASTPLEGQILTVDQNGEASFTSGGSGVTEVKAIAYAIALG